MKPLSERLETYAPTVARYGLVNPHSRKSLAALLSEAADLARKVEAAPVADIAQDGEDGESALIAAATRAGYYNGKRVALVEVGDERG